MGEAAAVPVRASWVSTSRFSQTTIKTASELTGRVAPDVLFRVQFATPSWARVAIKAVKPGSLGLPPKSGPPKGLEGNRSRSPRGWQPDLKPQKKRW